MHWYLKIKLALYEIYLAAANKRSIAKIDIHQTQEALDEWKFDFDYFREETKKRGLVVSYKQASDFASHVAFLLLDGKMELERARKHAFNRVLVKEANASFEPKFSILFIQNIPDDCQLNELRKYVEKGLKTGWFYRSSGRVIKVESLAILCKQTNLMEYHGLVHIDSKTTDLSAIIERLKLIPFKRKIMLVREYKQRFWQNDNRQQANQTADRLLEQRRGDRRRGDEVKIFKNTYAHFNQASASI